MSLLRRILKRAIFNPTKTAVTDDQRTYSYFKVVAGAMFVAKAIRESTDKPHVGIMLPTSGAFPVALLGAWLAKKVPVPLNYLLSQDELSHVVEDSGIDTIVTAGKMIEYLDSAEIDVKSLPNSPKLMKLEELSFKGLPPLAWPKKHRADELAVLLYTSGTSGKPKGVMLTHGNLESNVDDCVKHAGLTRCDAFLGVLPQFHSFGLTVLTMLPLSMGAPVVYTARFIPRKLVELIKKHQPHVFVAVPSMYAALLTVKNTEKSDFEAMQFVISGGEPLPDAVRERVSDRLGVDILEGYGLTETSPVTHWSTPQHSRLHSVGKPLPRVEHFIVDENDKVLGPNEEGEILLHGPNVMKGYYQLPELTEQAIIQLDVPGRGKVRCFRTGDIGKFDNDNFLYITGRKKEMLIIGGENVFPREIEEVLNKHDSVAGSAVIGRKCDMRGEVAIAFVELREDAPFDEGALRQHCKDRMASFKVPKEIRYIESLPRNPTGKILRRELKA